jgi:hypothetical protein
MSSNISKGTKALVEGGFVPTDDIGIFHRIEVASRLTSNSPFLQADPGDPKAAHHPIERAFVWWF